MLDVLCGNAPSHRCSPPGQEGARGAEGAENDGHPYDPKPRDLIKGLSSEVSRFVAAHDKALRF